MSEYVLVQDKSEKNKYGSSFTISMVVMGSIIAAQYTPIVNPSSSIIKPQVIIDNVVEAINYTEDSSYSNRKYYDIDQFGIKAIEVTYTDLRFALSPTEKFININEISDVEEGGTSMLDQLYSQKVFTEKLGIIGGSVLGLLTSISPIFIDVQWIATIPATLIFLSIPLFIFIHRYFNTEEE